MTPRSRTLLLAALTVVAGVPAARADEDFDELQQKAVQEAVRRVAPCVVQIETSGGTEVMAAGPGGLIRRGVGPTSGLVVDPDGYIISSAFNFANKPAAIRVAVPGHKERYVARVVATDQARMLTLLKIDPEGNAKLPVPVPAPKKEVRIGHTAIAVGRTLTPSADEPPSVSVGIVSALERIWGRAVQTDAKVSPTNYGGPLIDLQGRVIGVLVPASPRADGETAGFEWYDSGIGFAIPLEDVNRVLPRMKAGTEQNPVVLKRGLLGINVEGQDPTTAAPVVASVAPGSAAERAGIKARDEIIEISGRPVASQAQMMHQLGPHYEGDVVSVKVRRGKEVVAIDKVTLAGSVAAAGQAFLGILPVRDDAGQGVEVRYVFPKSPADRAGIKEGDRVLRLGRQAGAGGPVAWQPVPGRDRMMALLSFLTPGTDVVVELTRKAGGKTENVTVKLGEVPDEVPAKVPQRSSAKQALGKAAGGKKDDKKPETGLLKRTTAAGDHTYWVYVPDNYDPQVAHALVVWLHPAGKNKDRDVEAFVGSWDWECEDYHMILLIPRTDNERGWTQGEAEFVQESIRAVAESYTVDRQRVVAHGMGLGGEMAFYLGFHARNLIRGVATTGAALTSNPREKVANQPLSFFLAAGDKDPLCGAVKESRDKLAEQKYPVIYREVPNMGHQYLDGKVGRPTLDELIRWIDALDRM
jgi:S1-C subfamily serine protease/poly(3-hydroxybutyrate) depolymerase